MKILKSVMALCAILLAGIASTHAQTPTVAQKAIEHPAQASAIVLTAELQTLLPSGDRGYVVFYDSDKVRNDQELVSYATKSFNAPCRLATDKEIEAISAKFGKTEIYGVAKKLKLGDGNESAFRMDRNIGFIVQLKQAPGPTSTR